jgi:intracellular multiplication protein IcmE
MDQELASRLELCGNLGFASLADAHQLIVACAKAGIGGLSRKRLRAEELQKLGYTLLVMRELGYSDSYLLDLGYKSPLLKKETETIPDEAANEDKKELDALIASGASYMELKANGYGVHRCKGAGYSPGELGRLGFPLSDLAKEYSVVQLKNEGFDARELLRHFTGRDLRTAGFTARQLKNEGFGIEELRGFGFNENELVTAEYSNKERLKSGLRKRTIDDSGY